jgi:hypothetical protein
MLGRLAMGAEFGGEKAFVAGAGRHLRAARAGALRAAAQAFSRR